MSPTRQRSLAAALAVAMVAAGIDAATKVAATSFIDHPVGLGIASLRVVRNSGVAFGLGAGTPSWLLLALTAVVAVMLVVAMIRDGLASNLAAGLVFGGAVANIGDRALDGTVVDVIDLRWWPAFNLADVWIVAGVLMLFASLSGSHVGQSEGSSRDGS